MDPITLVLRSSKSPAASEPTGGELSSAEVDANWNNLKTAAEQLDTETVKVADAVVLGPGDEVTAAAGDKIPAIRGSTTVLIDAEDMLDQTAAEIRDALETLTTTDRLDASAIQNLPSPGYDSAAEVRDALEMLSGADRLEASAIQNLPSAGYSTAAAVRDALETLTTTDRLDASAIQGLPTVEAFSPITVTHDGAGETPVTGDTLTANFVTGWSGPIQWQRAGTNIESATSASYTLVEADEGQAIRPVFTAHVFSAPAITPESGDTVPDAFEVGDWTATAGDGQIVLNITALPDDGGSTITALQYRLDGGSAVGLTGTGTGERTISSLTNATSYDVEIRQVNAVGNSPWSDVKTRTPVAAGGSLTVVQTPAVTNQPFAPATEQTLTAVGSGNSVVVVFASSNTTAPTITDSGGGTWTQIHSSIHGFGGSIRFYKRDSAGGITFVRATYDADQAGHAAAIEFSGVGTGVTADVVDSGSQSSVTNFTFPFTSTVANTYFMGSLVLEFAETYTGVSPLTAFPAQDGFAAFARGVFASAGSNTGEVSILTSKPGQKAWVVLRPGT